MATVIYQVEAKVRGDLIADFEEYMLETHICDVMKTGKFEKCIFAGKGNGIYQIQYFTDHEQLQEYIEKEAPALRGDFIKRFPEGVEINRSELEILRIW
ncbi:MAG: DUF4286 family protein [Acidobacteria bacterium]|jgi:hypothetical protein|nr:MAG: DUF4286 family protein [Acidobacteriota bacterium]GIU81845.1 MAG: hypothetical protein KatS3mg006_0909 [Pyrinomonadaceae bacterium]